MLSCRKTNTPCIVQNIVSFWTAVYFIYWFAEIPLNSCFLLPIESFQILKKVLLMGNLEFINLHLLWNRKKKRKNKKENPNFFVVVVFKAKGKGKEKENAFTVWRYFTK